MSAYVSFLGKEPEFVGNYRVTDADSLLAANDAAGRICTMIESKLSPGPSLTGIRRHGDNSRLHGSVSVVSGNFLAAKVLCCLLVLFLFTVNLLNHAIEDIVILDFSFLYSSNTP